MTVIASPAGSPTRRDGDLTAKARIRNAALELYATYGEDATSMRSIAGAAGVTVGLVVHHFQTKDGLRDAIELWILDLFTTTIDSVPVDAGLPDVASARAEAVGRMLDRNPAVIGYLRRAVLDPTGHRGHVLEMLTNLAVRMVAELREAGVASTEHRDEGQVISVIVRQLGELLLQPMVDTMWAQLAGPDAGDEAKPRLVVRLEQPD